jgi:hypothetical protein
VARACAFVLIGGGNRQAILKRLLSFENPWIRLYGLKLIKNLTKFLGRKWRTSTHSPHPHTPRQVCHGGQQLLTYDRSTICANEQAT